jgi:CHAD domain-containing protein
MPVSLSRYALLNKRLQRFTRMLHRLGSWDVRALHRTRVASRRLRELLPVLQLEGKIAGALGNRLRKVTQRLGRVRELDVMLLLVEELGRSGRYDGDALARVASVMAQAREAERERLREKLPVRDLQRMEAKLGAVADELEAADTTARRSRTATRGLRWAVDARIERRASALRSAIESAGAVYLPDRLHRVRISLKKLRYALELADEMASSEALTAHLRLLKRNQDVLGRWHDRQVLIDRVRQIQASLTPPEVATWRQLDALVATLEDDCRRLHARYVRASGALVAACDQISVGPPATTAWRRAGAAPRHR